MSFSTSSASAQAIRHQRAKIGALALRTTHDAHEVTAPARRRASRTLASPDVGSSPAPAGDWDRLVTDGIQACGRLDDAKWELGDLALSVLKRYGEATLEKYAAEIGVPHESLRRYRQVAARFENGTRVPNLSWSHHRIAASSPDRDALLAGAARKGWSVGQLGAEISRAAAARAELFDFERAVVTPRACCGDLWLLGEHRLLCGDSTDGGDIGRLLSGSRPGMAFTDPPYNVRYGEDGNKQRGGRHRPIANDSFSPEESARFVAAWGRNLLENVDGAVYVSMGTKNFAAMTTILEDLGGHQSDAIVWVKNSFVMGRADYQRRYELVWYGWREGVSHYWCGDRDQDNVWEIDRPTRSDLHPMMKPLALVERAIENSSRLGDTVLDLFLGSGTTLIAAERTGRICYGIEIEPAYCDAIVARWEEYTGLEAIREPASNGAEPRRALHG